MNCTQKYATSLNIQFLLNFTKMKSLLLFLSFSCTAFAQTAVYNKITAAGLFKEYQTKSGDLLKIGDTITIGFPRLQNFTFITQGNQPAGASISNAKITVSKIRTVGNPKRGYKTYALFGGYGFSVYIDYESALEVGEIKNPFTN